MDQSPAPAATTSTAPSTAAPAHQGGIKETIESILIAFILAFIFRAFVVEAFVIPTGSMAPTLLGAHVRFDCSDCGYQYDTNFSSNATEDQRSGDINIPPRSERTHYAVCPNCGYEMSQDRPTVRYGDRILVLKYLDVLDRFGLVNSPKRWEVVVFKAPHDPNYQQNYIKRLVALPNESVMILDGDVYTAGDQGTDINQFKIQRKSPEAQEALWRIVYHNDYFPRGLPRGGAQARWQQPWRERTPGSGWDLAAEPNHGRIFTFDNANGFGSVVFDRDVNPDKKSLTDWLAYDDQEQHYRTRAFVSDLLLDLYYARKSGDGPLRLSLRKEDDQFIAELTRDMARLIRVSGGGAEQVLSEAAVDLSSTSARHLRFSNVDYRVTLEIDRKPVLQTTDEQYSPNAAKLIARVDGTGAATTGLPPAIEITAAQQTSELSHLALWRDIYYLNGPDGEGPPHAGPQNFPNNVLHLKNDEFFVLGDNSAISLDARYWRKPINLPAEDIQAQAGTVPARFMLGRAFFVYWPAGYSVTSGPPSLVPNFGEMRFID